MAIEDFLEGLAEETGKAGGEKSGKVSKESASKGKKSQKPKKEKSSPSKKKDETGGALSDGKSDGEEMRTFTSDELCEALVREYLAKKGLKEVAAVFDEEKPREEGAIRSTAILIKALKLTKQYKANKEKGISMSVSELLIQSMSQEEESHLAPQSLPKEAENIAADASGRPSSPPTNPQQQPPTASEPPTTVPQPPSTARTDGAATERLVALKVDEKVSSAGQVAHETTETEWKEEGKQGILISSSRLEAKVSETSPSTRIAVPETKKHDTFYYARWAPPSHISKEREEAEKMAKEFSPPPVDLLKDRYVSLSSSDVAKYKVGMEVRGIGPEGNISGIIASREGSKECGQAGPGTITVDTRPELGPISSSSTSPSPMLTPSTLSPDVQSPPAQSLIAPTQTNPSVGEATTTSPSVTPSSGRPGRQKPTHLTLQVPEVEEKEPKMLLSPPPASLSLLSTPTSSLPTRAGLAPIAPRGKALKPLERVPTPHAKAFTEELELENGPATSGAEGTVKEDGLRTVAETTITAATSSQ